MRSGGLTQAVPGEEPAADSFIALVGAPNCGKTTLFNWLTGSKFKTVNYPGSTVDYSVGQTHERFGAQLRVMDTPGTYSLEAKSPDEQVTVEAIFRHPSGPARLVVSIADATQLSRHLFVTKQLQEAGFAVVLAVTMTDLAKERGDELNKNQLERELGAKVVFIDGRLGGGVQELVDVLREELSIASPSPHHEPRWQAEQVERTLRDTKALEDRVTRHHAIAKNTTPARERTRRLDKIFLHPVGGLVIFLLLMTALFTSIFWAAAPLMDVVDQSLSFVGGKVLAVNEDSLLMQFLANGVVASAAAVFVFVPQIFILFVGIILLEDSGYLARSATLVDKPLAKLGMGGRSFVPLLSGYACAVPAMMAARTINSRKERLLTLFVVPLMSCSARLPVYALLLAFISATAWQAGLTLALIYFASLATGAVVAAFAGRFFKSEERSFFMLELPVYRRPKASLVLRQALMRTKSYVKRAGPAIFVFALIMWSATTFPRYDLKEPTERLDHSYAAKLGQFIEPVFEPMGGDWRTGVGLISAFAAREVFVSSLAVVFQVASDDEGTMQSTLLEKMREAKAPNGLPLFTIASVVGLTLFFMIALQCLSTVVIAVRESGSWKFAITQLVVFNVLGYVVAVAAVQGLRALGIP